MYGCDSQKITCFLISVFWLLCACFLRSALHHYCIPFTHCKHDVAVCIYEVKTRWRKINISLLLTSLGLFLFFFSFGHNTNLWCNIIEYNAPATNTCFVKLKLIIATTNYSLKFSFGVFFALDCSIICKVKTWKYIKFETPNIN